MKPIRIKKRKEFVAVALNGVSAVTCGLVLQMLPQTKTGVRIGYTTTKKLGNAVVRNRIRRRLRALTDTVFKKISVRNGDYVLIGRKASFDRPFHALEKDLIFAVHEVNRLYRECAKNDVLNQDETTTK